MKVEIIEKDGRPEFAVAGESAVKLWREHWGLTQQELATRAGISKPYLSQIKPANAKAPLKLFLL